MYYSNTPITIEQAAQVAPSILAQSEHESRSDRYAYVPTVRVLEAMQREGFQIHGVTEAHVRTADRRGFQKHLLRMRKPGNENKSEAPEIVLINSHDGSTTFQLMAGMIRFACANGIITGDMWDSVKVKHSGEIVGDVIEGSYRVMNDFDELGNVVDEMKSITLTRDEQDAFTRAALPLRFEGEAPVTVEQINYARRSQDQGADLWRTFNRVQENLLQGGVLGRKRDANNRIRRRRTRAVNGVDGNVKLNRALFTLAEAMMDLKTD